MVTRADVNEHLHYDPTNAYALETAKVNLLGDIAYMICDLLEAVVPLAAPINIDQPYAVQEGMTLTCTKGNWKDPPPHSYSFQWSMDGAEIEGADYEAYSIVSEDIGKTFVCEVTAINSTGSTSIFSNEVTVA